MIKDAPACNYLLLTGALNGSFFTSFQEVVTSQSNVSGNYGRAATAATERYLMLQQAEPLPSAEGITTAGTPQREAESDPSPGPQVGPEPYRSGERLPLLGASAPRDSAERRHCLCRGWVQPPPL